MILLIVFLLSAHVIGTNRDLSVERLVDEGFHVTDDVLARDSRGFERVVSQFRGPQDPQLPGPREHWVDVVPSWLLGGAGGTTEEIHLGDSTYRAIDRCDYEIQERADWTISYYRLNAGDISLIDFAMNELLGRCRHISAANVVYFSRPNPGTALTWMYTIIDHGPRRLKVGDTPIPTSQWMNQALPLRAKCRVIEAVTDFSFLRLRHPHIKIHPFAHLIQSQTQVNPDDPETLMAATFVPVGGSFEQPHRGVSLPDTLSEIGHMIHSLAFLGNRYNRYNGIFDEDEFIRRAFFLDSENPAPLRNAEGQVYQFRSLEEVIGHEFPEYARDEIPSKFAQFVDLFTRAWRMAESDPTSIPPRVESIVDLIDQIAPFVLK
jgi:hypothetical protein